MNVAHSVDFRLQGVGCPDVEIAGAIDGNVRALNLEVLQGHVPRSIQAGTQRVGGTGHFDIARAIQADRELVALHVFSCNVACPVELNLVQLRHRDRNEQLLVGMEILFCFHMEGVIFDFGSYQRHDIVIAFHFDAGFAAHKDQEIRGPFVIDLSKVGRDLSIFRCGDARALNSANPVKREASGCAYRAREDQE